MHWRVKKEQNGKNPAVRISDHFSFEKLLRFVFPSIVMMTFTSIYSVVDGIFVSNFVGKTPFAAVNLIMPVTMAVGSLGLMIGTGGSALVAKTLSEGKKELALFGLDGIWSAIVVAELLAAVVTVGCLVRFRGVYHY